MQVLIVVVACLLASAAAQANTNYEFEEQPNIQTKYDDPQNSNNKDSNDIKTSTWIPILEYNKEQGEDGSYKTSYKTGNNIDASESGFIKDISEDHPGGTLVQHGSYSYIAPDGTEVNVEYIADEQGFRATGAHIPTAPPVPPEIQKSLDQIYAGIKLQQELREKRLLEDPDFAKTAESRAALDYNGQYYQDRL